MYLGRAETRHAWILLMRERAGRLPVLVRSSRSTATVVVLAAILAAAPACKKTEPAAPPPAQPVISEPLPPFRHPRPACLQFRRDLLVGTAFVGQQNDPGPFHYPVLGFSTARPFPQLGSLLTSKTNHCRLPKHHRQFI